MGSGQREIGGRPLVGGVVVDIDDVAVNTIAPSSSEECFSTYRGGGKQFSWLGKIGGGPCIGGAVVDVDDAAKRRCTRAGKSSGKEGLGAYRSCGEEFACLGEVSSGVRKSDVNVAAGLRDGVGGEGSSGLS